MGVLASLHRLLTYYLYKWGIRPAPVDPVRVPETPSQPLVGSHGLLEAEAILMIQDPYVVLVVDHEFLDIPAYVEWDPTRRSIGIVQSGGAVAELRTLVPADVKELFETARTILLMTRFNGTKVAHRVNLIVHS